MINGNNELNESNFEISKQKYSAMLLAGKEVEYKFFLSNNVFTEFTYHLALIALSKLHLNFLHEIVISYIREIMSNAIKANCKRVYFKKENADINDQKEYDKLMKRFRVDVLFRQKDFGSILKKENLYILVRMRVSQNEFKITINNNAPLLPYEINRIKKRLSFALKQQSIIDDFSEISDKTEGAGLGLVFLLTALKNSGIGLDSFSLTSDEKNTYTQLIIPQNLNTPENIIEIQNILANEIENIPTFPDSIHKVLSICDDSDSSLKDVNHAIEDDPGLASDIIKLANSAIFRTVDKVNTINRAVSKLGIRSIRQFVMVSASKNIINSHFKIYKDFWEHALKCAFYAKTISLKFKMKKTAENVFLGGLLHDLGKIILFSINPGTFARIVNLNIEGVNNRNFF